MGGQKLITQYGAVKVTLVPHPFDYVLRFLVNVIYKEWCFSEQSWPCLQIIILSIYIA